LFAEVELPNNQGTALAAALEGLNQALAEPGEHVD
jgi:hypothetical protein